MINYSKFEDINAVLNKAKTTITLIEEGYKEALHDQKISSELLVEIKDYLGNLKSSLDYLINKVSKNNFPIRSTEKDFDNVTSDLSDDLKLVIKKWQPFKGNQWIEWFNTINNKSKHFLLVPQIRKEQQTMTAKTEHVSVTIPINNPTSYVQQWADCQVFLGGVPVKITNQGIIPLAPGLEREITTRVSFEFKHENLPNGIAVLPFLKECFEKIIKIISEIEACISK